MLHPDGVFAFTVETHAGAGMILRETLRYAHARRYVDRVLEQVELRPLVTNEGALRNEKGAPVAALIVVATHA